MATAERMKLPLEQPVEKGLKAGALGLDYNVATQNDYTMWTIPGIHWQVGGAFVIAVIAVSRRRGMLPVLPDHQARILRKADPHQGHCDPDPRQVTSSGSHAARRTQRRQYRASGSPASRLAGIAAAHCSHRP
jgi:hypothetical protein